MHDENQSCIQQAAQTISKVFNVAVQDFRK